MKRMSNKARRRLSEAKPVRDEIRAIGRCESCGRSGGILDVHEISRGRHRQKALDKRFALLLLCRTCHEDFGDAAKWPESRQLALLAERRLLDWDLVQYLEMTNPRAPRRIEIAEVAAHMKEMLKVDQVAERMQVNRRTVQSWIDCKSLPAVDVRPAGAARAMWRIDPADLLAFTQARKANISDP